MWLYHQTCDKTLGKKNLHWEQIWTGRMDGWLLKQKVWINGWINVAQCTTDLLYLFGQNTQDILHFCLRTFSLCRLWESSHGNGCKKHLQGFRPVKWSSMYWQWCFASWPFVQQSPDGSQQMPTQPGKALSDHYQLSDLADFPLSGVCDTTMSALYGHVLCRWPTKQSWSTLPLLCAGQEGRKWVDGAEPTGPELCEAQEGKWRSAFSWISQQTDGKF